MSCGSRRSIVFCCSRGGRFPFRFKFSSIDFDDGVFDYGQQFALLVLFGFSCLFLFACFFAQDFRHGGFVVELIGSMTGLFHTSFQTTNNHIVNGISNRLKNYVSNLFPDRGGYGG